MLGQGFSFCHVDGGHSARETYNDLDLCCQVLLPAGVLALDDYFNPTWPGVCEGAISLVGDRHSTLKPIAIGYNKVFFQRLPAACDINTTFSALSPRVPKIPATMMGMPVYFFGTSFLPFFDLQHSTPRRLLPSPRLYLRVTLQPKHAEVAGTRGQIIRLPVEVANRSGISFPALP